MFKHNAESKSHEDHIQAKKRKLNEEEVTIIEKESNLDLHPIDLSVSSGDEDEPSKQGELEFNLREAKLATRRVAQQQAAVVAANSAIISKLEEHFLNAIGGRTISLDKKKPLPFEKFLEELNKTEPEDLRLYSVANDVRVDRLRKLHKFAYRIHTCGFIGSKVWVEKYYKKSHEQKEDKVDEE